MLCLDSINVAQRRLQKLGIEMTAAIWPPECTCCISAVFLLESGSYCGGPCEVLTSTGEDFYDLARQGQSQLSLEVEALQQMMSLGAEQRSCRELKQRETAWEDRQLDSCSIRDSCSADVVYKAQLEYE